MASSPLSPLFLAVTGPCLFAVNGIDGSVAPPWSPSDDDDSREDGFDAYSTLLRIVLFDPDHGIVPPIRRSPWVDKGKMRKVSPAHPTSLWAEVGIGNADFSSDSFLETETGESLSPVNPAVRGRRGRVIIAVIVAGGWGTVEGLLGRVGAANDGIPLLKSLVQSPLFEPLRLLSSVFVLSGDCRPPLPSPQCRKSSPLSLPRSISNPPSASEDLTDRPPISSHRRKPNVVGRTPPPLPSFSLSGDRRLPLPSPLLAGKFIYQFLLESCHRNLFLPLSVSLLVAEPPPTRRPDPALSWPCSGEPLHLTPVPGLHRKEGPVPG